MLGIPDVPTYIHNIVCYAKYTQYTCTSTDSYKVADVASLSAPCDTKFRVFTRDMVYLSFKQVTV